MTIDEFNKILERFKEKWNTLPNNKGMEIKEIMCVSETDRERKQGQARVSINTYFNSGNKRLHKLKTHFKSNVFIESSDSEIDIDKYEQELVSEIALDYTINMLIKEYTEQINVKLESILSEPSKKKHIQT
jgi:hypothetical protein